MGSEGDDQQSPLLGSYASSFDPEESFQRTGTQWTAMAHVITGVIGAGVLSLAWSVAQLGWIAGPVMLIVFAGITVFSTYLLCDCYRSPDPEHGPTRNSSYTQAVKFYLGGKNQRWCGLFANESLYGAGIAYNITAASSVSQPLLIFGLWAGAGENQPRRRQARPKYDRTWAWNRQH